MSLNKMSVEDSQIRNFFKNQTIFLTGGSGFLGKILIEKLLRSCSDVERIYVLLRAKKGKTPEERFNELFDYACFDRLKTENINAFEKVTLVTGDCQDPSMGLEKHNLEILKRETTCFIHAAANVKFDQSLREATNNVKSTKYALELAKEMSNLKVFVYVSTAYSNCPNSTIKEEFYDPPMKAENLFAVLDGLEDEKLESITPILLGKWPNTYVYTKCVSEDLVNNASKDLPVVVVRPAIVISSKDEPMPGWIDNFYGVLGISIAGALGIIKTMHMKGDVICNIVPVDLVANCILASTWRRAKSDTTRIYNFVGSPENTMNWKTFEKITTSFYWDVPFNKSVWYYSFNMRKNKLWNNICVFFLHTLVGYIIDFVLFWCGKPTIAVKSYRRLNKMLTMLSYFTTNEWNFHINNVEELWNEMTESDQKYFNFDMKNFDWNLYFYNAYVGSKLYLLKESKDTIPEARRRYQFLFVIHYTVLALFYYLIYKIFCFVFSAY